MQKRGVCPGIIQKLMARFFMIHSLTIKAFELSIEKVLQL